MMQACLGKTVAEPAPSITETSTGANPRTENRRELPPDDPPPLSGDEIVRLRLLLSRYPQLIRNNGINDSYDNGSVDTHLHQPQHQEHEHEKYYATTATGEVDVGSLERNPTFDSDYPEYRQSTHAWAVFADDPKKRAGFPERLVGTIIIIFQLFAYQLFAVEAIDDYQKGEVYVKIGHGECLETGGVPDNGANNLQCDADFTNQWDCFVAFFMLAIFFAEDFIQAGRSLKNPPIGWRGKLFASLAAVEVVCAFLAAAIAVSYNLFIGEVTDAVEVGVGLLFIRELSQRTYRGLRDSKTKKYRTFFLVIFVLVGLGLMMDPICAFFFAGYIQ